MIRIYGIKQCSTMKKAFEWLEAQSLTYEFHDYKKSPPSEERLKLWSSVVGWQKLLNQKGTTWRNLSDDVRKNITEQSAIQWMHVQPSLIKRPVVEAGPLLLLGFDTSQFSSLLEHIA